MLLSKQQVLERLCFLANSVMNGAFACQHSADCFCGVVNDVLPENWRFESEVLEFIEQATQEKLRR
jgi:hypothetical protein